MKFYFLIIHFPLFHRMRITDILFCFIFIFHLLKDIILFLFCFTSHRIFDIIFLNQQSKIGDYSLITEELWN